MPNYLATDKAPTLSSLKRKKRALTRKLHKALRNQDLLATLGAACFRLQEAIEKERQPMTRQDFNARVRWKLFYSRAVDSPTVSGGKGP